MELNEQKMKPNKAKLKFISMFLTVIIIAASGILPAKATYAEIDPILQQECALTLNKLKVMLGDNSGNLNLGNNITRSEFVTLVIRIMGYDRDNNTGAIILNFNDSGEIYPWANEYVKLAIKYGLLKGYPGNIIKPNAIVTNAEAQTILLRALGYEKGLEGNWPDNILAKSKELGLGSGMLVEPSKALTRGESAVVIYNSLSINFKLN